MLTKEEKYCACPACGGNGSGQGDNTYCGFCGGDGSVPESAYVDFQRRHPRVALRAREQVK